MEELGDRITAFLNEEELSDYPTASLTADVVAFQRFRGQTYVLLVKRASEPFKGQWALPGGFVDARNDEHGEKPEDAALRELYEETGVAGGALTLVGVYADPGRDPRGRVVTFAYSHWSIVDQLPHATAGDDAAEARWFEITQFDSSKMAFDHEKILLHAWSITLGLR